MEYIQFYSSDDNASNDSDKELYQRPVRSVYLVTYSQADMTKFPTRKSFGNDVAKYFHTTKVYTGYVPLRSIRQMIVFPFGVETFKKQEMATL